MGEFQCSVTLPEWETAINEEERVRHAQSTLIQVKEEPTMEKVKIGIIGCGNISAAYFKKCREFDILEVAACADLDIERAKARAAEFNVPKAYTVEELLSDPEIKIVINLTIPKAHAEVCLKALH